MNPQVPELLDKERALLPMLERLGASPAELEVLRGDEHLLKILAEDPTPRLSWRRCSSGTASG